MIPHPSWIEIDLQLNFVRMFRLSATTSAQQSILPSCQSQCLWTWALRDRQSRDKSRNRLSGVAHLQEAIKLRKAGVTIPILVSGAIHEDQIEDLIDNNLEFTISSKIQSSLVAEKSKSRPGFQGRPASGPPGLQMPCSFRSRYRHATDRS